MKNSNIFIISGPSGVGEDSIINGLTKYFPIEKIVTTSTRPMRSRESQSNPYYFIDKQEFETRREKGDFIEWAEQYNGQLYGVTKQEIERVKSVSRRTDKIGTWKIEWKGVITAKKLFPEIPAIFITIPDLKILEERIRRRDNINEAYIKERMAYTQEWMKHAYVYDYTVVNEEGKLDEAIKKVAEIIRKYI